jgi:predicted RNase H-like nuclease
MRRCDCWVAGVDGCPAGWMVVFARVNEEGSAELRLCVLPRFADILCADEAPAVIAVDIPIGLPAQARRCGRAARVCPLFEENRRAMLQRGNAGNCAGFRTPGTTT